MNGGDGRRWLLAGQTLLLGLYSGLLVIPASSIFLGRYGAENLPWTYIAGAVGAMVGTPVLARAVRRWTLSEIGVPICITLAAVSTAAWIGLEWYDTRWVSGPLWVLFPLGILIGFFLVGGQAGRVYDLREMKEQFPRVVVGFPLGFLVSGLLGDVLISVLGGVHRVLPIAAAAVFGLGVLVAVTARRFPAQLGKATAPSTPGTTDAPRRIKVPLRTLIVNRYVAILLGYQMLSQLGTQLVDFLLFERAATRYQGDAELGRFVARLTTGVNAFDLLFVLVLAAFLLRRYGMRVGLSLNPFVVTLLVVSAAAVALMSGIGSTGAFAFILVARVLDIAFTDGATRTALNTAYQAVPATDRLAVQATIEGLGVPIALGITGVILLVLQQGLGVGAWGIMLLTVGVGIVWTAAGGLVFRAYRTNLREGLECRVLAAGQLDVDDPATVAELDRMLERGDDRDVWLALTAFGDHPEMAERLAALVTSDNGRIAGMALRQLAVIAPERAVELAETIQDLPVTPMRLEALGLLAGHAPGSALVERIGAAFTDTDPHVGAAARRAAVASGDLGLMERLVDESRGGPHSVAAIAALSGAGDALVLFAARALAGDEGRHAIRLVNCLTASPTSSELLAEHVEHADRDVRTAVKSTLARIGGHDIAADLIDRQLSEDATRAGRILAAITVLPSDDRVTLLRRTLEDELANTALSTLATLALAGDTDLVAEAARGLRRRDDSVVAHAVETLELHLDPRRARMALPIIDRRLAASVRFDQLRAVVAVPVGDLGTSLAELADDPSGSWQRPWLSSCAQHTRAILAG